MQKKRSLLPYGDSTLSPPISSTENSVAEWKNSKNKDTEKYFSAKYNEIVKEMEKLHKTFETNKMIDNAELRFTPIVGREYYLYKREDDSVFVSMVCPKEWGAVQLNYLGAYIIDSQHVWNKVEEK